MNLTTQLLAILPFHLSVQAQWLSTDDYDGLAAGGLYDRSVEDYSFLQQRSYDYDDYLTEYYPRSLYLDDEQPELFRRTNRPAGGGQGSPKAGPSGSGGASSSGSKPGRAAASPNGKRTSTSSDPEAKYRAAPGWKIPEDQKARIAAKHGGTEGAKWTVNPKTGVRYFTSATGNKVMIEKDRHGRITGSTMVNRPPPSSEGMSSGSSSDSGGSSGGQVPGAPPPSLSSAPSA